MTNPVALTGADVERLRRELKLSRDAFMPYCAFPNARSAARLNNIERKESWKEGDHERVVNAFRTVYAERGLPLPEILSGAVSAGPAPAPVTTQAGPPPTATPLPADPATCPHAGGFTSRPEDGVWVCATCGGESPYAEQARLARQAMDVPGPAGALQVGRVGSVVEVRPDDVVAAVGTSVPVGPPSANGAAVVVDTTPLDEEWEELLDSFAVVDDADVERPDVRWTASEGAAWNRCRRQWWLAYVRRLAPRVDDLTSARASGGRVHRALQAWYVADPAARTSPRDALERAIVEDWTEVTRSVTNADDLAVVSERFAKANALERAMIEGYLEWLAENGADADYDVVGAEQVLTARLEVDVDGETVLAELLGKLDARLRRKSDGALLFVDHKTVTSLTDVVPTLRQNPQMLTYLLLEVLNAAGAEYVDGALYNMLRKVKRTAQAKPPFFDRVEVRHNVHEVDAHRRHVVGALRDAVRARRALAAGASHHDVVYPNSTPDCRYDCQFFRVCGMFDDGSPGLEDALAAVYVEVDPLARYAGLPAERAVDLRDGADA